jgi:hypothetical protein
MLTVLFVRDVAQRSGPRMGDGTGKSSAEIAEEEDWRFARSTPLLSPRAPQWICL